MNNKTTMQIGMVGLGRMGANMVRRLIKGGLQCIVFNRSPDKVKDHYCPVIARANLCNLLTAIEIGADSRRDDIFPAPVFSAKIVAARRGRMPHVGWPHRFR